MPKPLPQAILKPGAKSKSAAPGPKTAGIFLGDGVYWNSATLPNGHLAIIGASGSGKTQTLKAIAHDLPILFPEVRRVVIDFHGDQELPGEVCYHLDMESPYGVNPLVVDLDVRGGGPALQAIAVAGILRKALTLGVNQEGLVIEILKECYMNRGINQNDSKTWVRTPPTFKDLQESLRTLIENGDKEATKLALKLAATFQYGIFTKAQPSLDAPLIRFDLSALSKVNGLAAIASESLIKQLLDSHRLKGEITGKIPRTYLFIDEAKEVKLSQSLKLVLADGRKFGLNAALGSQRMQHFSDDVIANTATKIVLAVDQCEVAAVSKKFRFSDKLVAQLQPLEALVRMGTEGHKCRIKPYYERV